MTPKGLKIARRKLGLTQEALAGKLGVDRVSVARWETGTRPILRTVEMAVRSLAPAKTGTR